MNRINIPRYLPLVILTAVVFLTHLGSARLWDRDEPRNSRASQEMLARGDWIVPTFNGELRDHKPILIYWGQMLSYTVFGESEFAARLPSAVCALVAVLAVALLASKLTGSIRSLNATGWWAGGVLATCMLFVMAARAATPDAYLIVTITLSVTAFALGMIPVADSSQPMETRIRWPYMLFGYSALGFAILAKGPVGIVLPLAIIHAWWLVMARIESKRSQSLHEILSRTKWQQRLLMSVRWAAIEAWGTFGPRSLIHSILALRTIPGVALALLIAVPWYVAVGYATDGAFLKGFFITHNLNRAVSPMEGHGGGWWFYPVAFLVGTFPWSLWFIPLLLWLRKTGQKDLSHIRLVTLGCVWVGMFITAFTIASTKLPSYITPCYAGAALLFGAFFRDMEMRLQLPSLNWRRIAYVTTCAVGIAIFTGILVLSQRESMPLLAFSALAGIVIAFMGFAAFLQDRRGNIHYVPRAWLAGALAFQVILFGFGTRSIDRYRSDLAMLKNVAASSTSEHWLTIGGLEPSWVFYLNHGIEEVKTNEKDPASWNQLNRYMADQEGRVNVVIVGQHVLEEFRKQPIAAAMVQVAETKRFLRSGDLYVYQSVEPSAAADIARNQIGQSTTAVDHVAQETARPQQR